jgi:hypothetical protein
MRWPFAGPRPSDCIHLGGRYYASFHYQAGSWSTPPGGGQGRVASGRALPAGWLHRHQPGAAGRAYRRLLQPPRHLRAVHQEGKSAIKWTRLSCRSFAANAVRLQLHALAYNLGNFMRTLAMPKAAEPWSLTSVSAGAKIPH